MAVRVDNTANTEVVDSGNSINRAFRPLFTVMKLFGLYSDLISRYARKRKKILTVTNVAHCVYCLAIELFVLMNMVMGSYRLYSRSKDGVSSALASSITNVVLASSLTITIPIALWKLSCNLGELLEETQQLINSTKPSLSLLSCRNVMCLLIIISGVGLLAVSAVVITFSATDDVSRNETTWLLETSTSLSIFSIEEVYLAIICAWTILFVTISGGYYITIIVLYGFYVYVVCRCLNNSLNNIKQNLKQGMTDRSLSEYRTEFEALTEIVEKLDSCFNFFYGVVYMFCLIMPCLSLHGLVHERLSKHDVASVGYSIIFTGIYGGLCILCAVFMNGKMHQPLGILYRMNVENLTEKGVQELALFISRLSGPPIGISIFGLFVIDKSAVLMLVGTLVTYAVIVVQFKPTSAPCTL